MKKPSQKAPISRATHDALIDYITNILDRDKDDRTGFHDKLRAIDYAYFMKVLEEANDIEGLRKVKAQQESNPLEVPLVMSQVESANAYLTDIFASGYPLIGVIGAKGKEAIADKMEALLTNHAIRARWTPNIMQNIADNVRYNFGALEVTWDYMPGYELTEPASLEAGADVGVKTVWEGINVIRALDPYNTLWDGRFSPNEAGLRGDYVGYCDIMSMWELQQLLQRLRANGLSMNSRDAMESSSAVMDSYYTERPTIREYATTQRSSKVNWYSYLNGGPVGGNKGINKQSAYLRHKLYLRIIPKDFGLLTDNPTEPQLWEVQVINAKHIISIRKLVLADNQTPIILSSIKEDGYGIQTPSIAESIIPSQDAASELLNARLLANKRALGDRAIFDERYLYREEVESEAASQKMVLRTSFNEMVSMDNIYRQIPFDSSSTVGALQDIQQVLYLAEMSHGINSSQQGLFRKGNRTLGEVQQVTGASDMRSMLLALNYEFLVMSQVKALIKFNTMVRATRQQVLSPYKKELLDVDPAEFREAVLDFKLADGLINKSTLVPPEVFASMIQYMMQSEQLQQEYDVPAMALQLFSVQGIKNLSQYKREANAAPIQQAGPTQTQPQPATGDTGQ